MGEVKQKVGVQKANPVLKRSRARAVIHIRRFKRFEQAETANTSVLKLVMSSLNPSLANIM